ncbi:restriction endonuclease subunit S [Brachybacterium paraconglomeratum]|uniref:restriction endonuclease subunit S n=1 Tax=Brachybacterium paraconglomeratum TaxID=173362 RepID=UPI00223AB6CE|nr:restriction endonuclease subunit S [Brachybacterium paraconglomeratum]MCT1436032.1 restriction endonuclease subunit S [Brachybacterium paraconglomeratum]
MTIRMMLQEIAAPKGFIGGPFGSNLVSKDYVETGVPVIRGSNMGRTGHLEPPFVYVAEDKLKRDLSRNVARAGNLIFTQRGTLGQVVLLKGDSEDRYVISQSQMGLVVDKKVADARYVYYACTTKDFLAQIDSRAIRTGVPHLNLGILRELTIPRMSLGEQIAIAAVLGALDDKIAANRSCIALTSKLLDAKYRSTAKHRSELLFQDFADVGGGATPSTKKLDLWGQGVAWATPTDVTGLEGVWLDRTERTISPAGLASISSPLYPVGSIAMTSRATIGAVALLGVPMAVNQGFIVLEPKDPSNQLWLYCQLRDRVDELKAWANGATFLELPKKIFRGLPVELGSESDMREFAAFSTPLMERLHGAQRENAYLAATRDELLPLLMSGKITVKDAEKTVEEVV